MQISHILNLTPSLQHHYNQESRFPPPFDLNFLHSNITTPSHPLRVHPAKSNHSKHSKNKSAPNSKFKTSSGKSSKFNKRTTMKSKLTTMSSPISTSTNILYLILSNMTAGSPSISSVTPAYSNETYEPIGVVRRTTGELVVGTLTFIVITLMTVGGNTLVILSVFTYRPLNKVQNYFLVSLAASDLAVALLVTPFHVVKFIVGEWIFGLAFCQVWLTCDILCCTASILNLCAIALDRYWAIHDPIEYASKRTLRLVLSMIAVVWSLSVLISVPPLIGWNDWSQAGLQSQCELTTQREFVVYSACGSFFIPLIVMTTVYAKIFVAARQRLRNKRRSVRGLSTNSRGDLQENGSRKFLNRSRQLLAAVRTPSSPPQSQLPQQPQPQQGQQQVPAAENLHMMDPTTSTGFHSGGPDLQTSPLTVSPVTPASELSERTILLKEQQNGTKKRELDAKKISDARSSEDSSISGDHPQKPPMDQSSKKLKFKKLTFPTVASTTRTALLQNTTTTSACSRTPSVRSREFKEERGTRAPAGNSNSTPAQQAVSTNVQKFIKDRERISVTKEKKAAKTLAVIMGVFVLCWLPFFVMYLVKPFVDAEHWLLHGKVEEAITWLGYINSAINPVIYTIFNLDFRRAFQKFLCPFRPPVGSQN